MLFRCLLLVLLASTVLVFGAAVYSFTVEGDVAEGAARVLLGVMNLVTLSRVRVR